MKKKTLFGLLALVLLGSLFSISMVSAYRGDYSTQGPNYTDERHESMETAFETQDYAAWYDLMTANDRHPRVVGVVTQDNFETFAKVHEAVEDGDLELAAELRAELGLGNGNGPKDGSGYGKGRQMQKNTFIDLNNDGNCDNSGLRLGRR